MEISVTFLSCLVIIRHTRTMAKFLLLFIVLLINLATLAQTLSNVAFDKIIKATNDSTSSYYYPKIKEKLLQLDTTLTGLEYHALYYGNVFQAYYHPYGATDKEKEFDAVFQRASALPALEKLAQEVMLENPVNLELFYKMIISCNRAKNRDKAILWAEIYVSFLEVIYASGTGKACDNAFIVISVDDEYRIASDLGLKVVKQALIGTCDRLQFAKKGQKRKNRIKTLFFNVQFPLSSLSGAFDHIDQPLPDQQEDEEE